MVKLKMIKKQTSLENEVRKILGQVGSYALFRDEESPASKQMRKKYGQEIPEVIGTYETLGPKKEIDIHNFKYAGLAEKISEIETRQDEFNEFEDRTPEIKVRENEKSYEIFVISKRMWVGGPFGPGLYYFPRYDQDKPHNVKWVSKIYRINKETGVVVELRKDTSGAHDLKKMEEGLSDNGGRIFSAYRFEMNDFERYIELRRYVVEKAFQKESRTREVNRAKSSPISELLL